MRAKIIGTGSYLPKNIATNDFLSTIVDTNDEWITSRTGIKSRHLVSEDETTASMAYEAAKKALADAKLKPEDVELIIVATCTADTLVPSTACDVQGRLGAVNAVAFDLNAACSGFIFALNTADAYFQSGMYKNALIIGVETLSRIVDWADRSVCVLFADGAGAAVVTADETGVIAATMGSDGDRCHAIYVKSRENHNPFCPEEKPTDHLFMDGAAVFKFATKTVPKSIKDTLEKAGLTPEQVDCFLLHQANMRINQSIAKTLKVSMDKIPANMDHCGNTSGASVPLLLDEVNKKGLLKSGDTIVMAGFGAGLTWGTIVLTWA